MSNLNIHQQLQPYLPPTWSKTTISGNLFVVPKGSSEYEQVLVNFRGNEEKLYRHQDINQFGMFLIRQQHLQALNSGVNFVKVTRYCRLQRTSINEAIKFNLDERRIHETVTFTMTPPSVTFNKELVFVVSFVTREANIDVANLKPERDCDYYIEYVVVF